MRGSAERGGGGVRRRRVYKEERRRQAGRNKLQLEMMRNQYLVRGQRAGGGVGAGVEGLGVDRKQHLAGSKDQANNWGG